MARALGRYELLRPLARGGMAEVYLARRRAAGVEKWLVVKRMRPERSGDPRFLDLFVREARLSMSLVHQNIVPVFDFGRIDDQVFLAMERVEGKDLGSSLARAPGHRVPPLLAAFVAAECCQALDYAHQRKGPDGVALGIVHRDVTPRNVLLSWSGEVKLTDFGIAALAGEATARLLGTPQYMAPEQARSEPIDPRADIYAVGLLLREALSGVRPRPGADRESILDAARRGALLPWPALASLSAAAPPPGAELPADLALGSGDHTPDEPPGAPAALVAIADRATAGAAGDRYPDARSMLEELDHYIVGERARHKADSPERQLAAWLAAIWDGARDDDAADAAIEGDHLVSFLDDGAFDVIGTGTVRSLAATAADDAHDGAPPPGSVPAPTVPPALAGSTPPAAVAPAPLRASDSGGRSTRISSANTTVAAGSFDALPAHDHDRRVATPPRHRRRRAIVPLAIVALVAVAAAAVVTLASSSGTPSNATDPTTIAPRSPPPTSPPTSAPAGTVPAATSPSIAAPPPADSPSPPTPARPERPAAGQSAASPTKAPSAASPTKNGRPPSAPQASGQRPTAAQRVAEEARASSSAPSDAAKPVTCRVRVNFTPWAYYTVDHDAARHETPGTIDLAPGEHHLHVWNPELRIERDIVLTVPADRDTMNFSEPLQPAALRSDPPKP